MSSQLGRLAGFATKVQTNVVSAASSKLAAKPDINLPEDAGHHGEHTMALPNQKSHRSTQSMSSVLVGANLKFNHCNKEGNLTVKKFKESASVRSAHTDIKIPSFDDYRNSYTENPNESSKVHADDKQTYSYISTFGIGLATAYGAKAIVNDIVSNLAPSADVLALAKIEVKLSEIPEGKNVTVKWRSKPLFIRHRTAAEIERERSVDLASLRDPQDDAVRVKQPEWLVLLGICTHLGCVPLANAGDFNGYFCPCHGSHYDASGRIRKGPAPLNLEIPPYDFPEEDLLVVG